MRLFSAFLLLWMATPTVGFSARLPTTKGRTASWALQAISEIEHLNVVEEALNLADDTTTEASLQNILGTLEKRVNEGPGSLSLMEVDELQKNSDRLLAELKKKPDPIPEPVAVAVEPAAPVEETLSEEEQWAAQEDLLAAQDDLLIAASRLDATAVSALLEHNADKGLHMNEATANAAFWAVVQAVDRAEAQDKPLPAEVPVMLHHIFDADLQHVLGREKQRTNVTCMQPKDDGTEGKARSMNYIFDDSAHKDLPLEEGRRCEDGQCCDACSRNIFPTFASDTETDFDTFPDLKSLTFNNLKRVPTSTIIQFTRLVERVRRTIAHEYGLPLKTILPLQAYSRKYVAGTTQQGGGGGEGDHVTLHTDEATHAGYHYSCVLYLSTQGEHFEGGDFVFNDPADPDTDAAKKDEEKDDSEHPVLFSDLEDFDEDQPIIFSDLDSEDATEPDAYESLADEIRRAGRKLTPFHPKRGAAVIFSSGWENMHEVDTITSGTRYVVPCFFTTCPVPDVAYDQMVVGKPKSDEDIADDWLHLLLAHRQDETPLQSTARVKELFMKWHYMCAPLSMH